MVERRRFMLTAGAAVLSVRTRRAAVPQEASKMYGLIGKVTSVVGQRDAVIGILLAASANMPGCLSYVVAKDRDDDSGIWITEVWDTEASHTASLALPSVKDAIAKGRPLIAGFGERFVTTPIGGPGLGGR